MKNLYIGLSKTVKDVSTYFIFIFLLSGCAIAGHKDNTEDIELDPL